MAWIVLLLARKKPEESSFSQSGAGESSSDHVLLAICALVEQRNCELVDKVALMHRMDLHTVEAGALCIVSALAEITHKLVDLVDCQRAAGLV